MGSRIPVRSLNAERQVLGAGALRVALVVAEPLLARTPIRQSLIGVAAIAALVGIVNLVVLTRQMFVSQHDATQVAVLLIYSLGAGLGAAWGLARAQTSAVERLAAT